MNNILNEINNYIEDVKSKSYIDYHVKKFGTKDVRLKEGQTMSASKGSDQYIEIVNFKEDSKNPDTFRIGNNLKGGI